MSSLFSDGPPLTPPSSSPLCGHPNDTTLALSSLSYVIHQLSTLLLYTAPPPTHSTLSPSPQPALLTHSFLVVALSNVLHTSLQLVSPSFPPSPLSTLSSPPTPSLSTSTPTLPAHVTWPHSSPSPAHDAAPLSPPTSLSSPLSASILPSSSSPIVAAADSRHTIRVLTAIQTLPVQPSSAPITKLKHCSPAAARGHPSSVSPLRHASSSAIPPSHRQPLRHPLPPPRPHSLLHSSTPSPLPPILLSSAPHRVTDVRAVPAGHFTLIEGLCTARTSVTRRGTGRQRLRGGRRRHTSRHHHPSHCPHHHLYSRHHRPSPSSIHGPAHSAH